MTKVNPELQKFITKSANGRFVTNEIKQRQIANADYYREKYLEVAKEFEEKAEKANEQDWEEKLRREDAETRSKGLKDTVDTRRSLKWILLTIIIVWIIFVSGIVLLQGFNVNIHIGEHHIYFKLANSVLNMLLGTTTISVFGLYKAVTDYFFKANN